MDKYIKAVFNPGDRHISVPERLSQWDVGLVLQITGLTLPETTEVHFANSGDMDALRVIAKTKDGVTEATIPNEILQSSGTAYAYVYVTDKESSRTEYKINLYINRREKPQDYAPENQPDVIGQLRQEISGKVDKYQGVENKGRVLVVGEDGNVVPGNAPSGEGGSVVITQATEKNLGGIKAKKRTTETLEVAIDSATGKLYVQDKSKPTIITMRNWDEVAQVVKSGRAAEIFNIGDQFTDIWTDKAANKKYEWVWDIVHMGDVTLESGEVVPGMYLKAHYTTPFEIQFDHEENERATESTFSADYSYYTKNPDGSYKLEEVVVGQSIPLDKEYFHSAIKDTTGNICRWGYNRWSHSAIRQWLNSDKDKGMWWTAQHLGDVAPTELNSKAGFLSGFGQDFLSIIKKVKIRTQINTTTDKEIGTDEETVDLMFLPSKEQMYGSTESGVYNDEAFGYYKKTTGFDRPKNDACDARIHYRIDSKSSAQWTRLRSPIRGIGHGAWIADPSGNINGSYSYGALVCSPVCVIC